MSVWLAPHTACPARGWLPASRSAAGPDRWTALRRRGRPGPDRGTPWALLHGLAHRLGVVLGLVGLLLGSVVVSPLAAQASPPRPAASAGLILTGMAPPASSLPRLASLPLSAGALTPGRLLADAALPRASRPMLSPLLAAASRSPASLQGLFEQALADSRDGRFGEALPLWDQVLERDPDDAAAWSNRGNVRLALGDADGAIADQERAMALDPANPDPHLNRGTAEEALGRWQAAADDYAWILERDPADASALYNLGNVRGSLGDWQEARRSFQAAAEARPGFAMARSSAALAAFQLGELDEAERELRSLIRRHPLFADARAGLTALLWQRGAAGEAESHWAAAAGLDPRYRQEDWLLAIRRWPPNPVRALQQFLALAPAREPAAGA